MTSNKKDKKSFCFISVVLVIGAVIGMIVSLAMAQIVAQTSDAKFCTSCHTMEVMAESYHASLHGGNNKEGVEVECNDCHLPHDNILNYMYHKAKIGLHDARVQMFGDLEAIDWEAKRRHAKDYVFDSGCLSCHANLEILTGNTKAFIAHRQYFLKFVDKKCVECHENVGHHNLGHYLKKLKRSSDD